MRVILFLFIPLSVFAQDTKKVRKITIPLSACSGYPGMTPSTAIPVCGATTFNQSVVISCTGPDLPNSVCPLSNITTNNSF